MNECGTCRHWHKFDCHCYKTKLGTCDKIIKGEIYHVEDIFMNARWGVWLIVEDFLYPRYWRLLKESDPYYEEMFLSGRYYMFDGECFEDECYDDCLRCWEPI